MKNKKTKIRWGNVALLIILLFCIGIVFHDIYLIIIQPWINGQFASWTWLGLIMFISALVIGGLIIDYFIDEINKQ